MPDKSPMRRILSLCLILFSGTALWAAPLEKTFSGEGARVVLRLEPGAIDPSRGCEATLSAEATPPRAAVLPPDLTDRFEGFDILGSYVDESGTLHLSLFPKPGAERFCVRPFAVTVTDSSVHPPVETAFATGMVRLRTVVPPESPVKDIVVDLKPVYIWPSFRILLRYALEVLAVLCALFLVWLGIRALVRYRRILKMSPRERALRELGLLLARDLPGKGRYKDYYVELTMVVRRFIQRRYGIKAPRLTTEEFLAAARESADFSAFTIERLSAFLESADLIKFAGVQATPDHASGAAEKARDYIQSAEVSQ